MENKTNKQYIYKEAGLLKLNCDKALHELEWIATWGFEETVRETALWYKEYYLGKKEPSLDLTLSQINKFVFRNFMLFSGIDYKLKGYTFN